MKFLVGTASWTDKTLIDCGRFYPADCKTPEARLRFYASNFPLVEVDSSYYAIPVPATAQLWVERTPDDFVRSPVLQLLAVDGRVDELRTELDRAPLVPIVDNWYVLSEAAGRIEAAALVHGANHAVTLAAQSAAVLSRLGIEEPGRLLRPLVEASIGNALGDAPGSVSSLTGPVVRGDAGTVAAHLAALEGTPETRATYRAMALATADLALAGGRIGPAQYADLVATLGLE